MQTYSTYNIAKACWFCNRFLVAVTICGDKKEVSQMPPNKSTLMKRYLSTAKYNDRVAKRSWALAKNNPNDGYYYERAREHYRRRDANLAKAAAIKAELEK